MSGARFERAASRCLGDLLVAEGLITEEQLQRALQAQRESSDKLGTVLMRLGIVNRDKLVGFLSHQYGIPTVRLSQRRYPRWETDISAQITRMVRSPFSRQRGASGQIVDLSLAGCRLVTPMELSVGAVVGLSFRLPEKSTIVTLHGVVRRTRRGGEEYLVAVEFIGLPEHIAEALGVTASVGPVCTASPADESVWVGRPQPPLSESAGDPHSIYLP